MASSQAMDSASSLPTGLLTRLSRSDGFRIMFAVPVAAAAIVLSTGINVPASCLTLGVALIVASVTDIRHRKIYNWTTYPLVVTGIAFAALVDIGSQLGYNAGWVGSIGLVESLSGVTVCGAITFVAYIASRGGAGDVKLAAGVGSLLGPEMGTAIIAAAYIAAALFVLASSCLDGSVGRVVWGLLRCISNWFTPLLPPPSSSQREELSKTIPLAGFFAFGTLVVMVWV